MALKLAEFIKTEFFSGILLIISLFLAIIISNTPLYQYYSYLIKLPISFGIGNLKIEVTLIELVNDGLMALFFLLIGLEIKYHIIEGEYKEKHKLFLPAMAAIGSVVIPSLFYTAFNYNEPTAKGWAIAIATDTAFVLCILSFFGRKISVDLRIFVLGLSLIDDIIAVVILAIFYSKSINLIALSLTIVFILLLGILNYFKVKSYGYYLLVGAFLWRAIIEAGIHGTLAGIIIALLVPVSTEEGSISPLKQLEQILHPIVNYIILPIFAFINSEIPLKNISAEDLSSNLSLGIILGLFLGKQLGIFIFSYIPVKLQICNLPDNTSWAKYYAVGTLAGIGFTLSLFIGGLSFSDPDLISTLRISIIIGSAISALTGIIILRRV
ncbi:MAG: Na+/H+ antiporter NhaA [Rickettsiales endosymbiont of Dermacentor nuttalli]